MHAQQTIMSNNDGQKRSRSYLLPIEDEEFLLRDETRDIRNRRRKMKPHMLACLALSTAALAAAPSYREDLGEAWDDVAEAVVGARVGRIGGPTDNQV